MRLSTLIPVLIVVALVTAAAVYCLAPDPYLLPRLPFIHRTRAQLEAEARRDFYRRHPGEKPLNWKIAAKAEEFYRTQPMGRFRLHKNDCSDFVEAVCDDALGAQARFRRDSDRHILTRKKRLWDVFWWDRKSPLLPGDEVSVEHSPHYEPHEGAIWHVGVVGPDGMVYDWSKLKSWPTDRYGRNSVDWFARHSPGPSSCLCCQARAASAGSQGWPVLSIEFMMTSSLRAQAVSATFGGFPASRSRW